MEKIRNFFKDESGVALVEYALLVTFIALASVAVLTTLGPVIAGKFTEAQTGIQG